MTKTVFQLRLTEEELECGKKRAAGLGMSLAAMLRALMVGELCQEKGTEGIPLVSRNRPPSVPRPVVNTTAKAHHPRCACLSCQPQKQV